MQRVKTQARRRADQAVVLAAVAQDGWSLQHAAPPLRADREVALVAVAQCGGALRWAAAPLRADRAVVLAAVEILALVSSFEALLRMLLRCATQPCFGRAILVRQL